MRISRRITLTQADAFLSRCWDRAITDDLAIAVGSSLQPSISLPVVGELLNREFRLGWPLNEPAAYYEQWEEFINNAEQKAGWKAIRHRLLDYFSRFEPTQPLLKVAGLPISNFIDCTLDRSLVKAVLAVGKRPMVHDERAMRMGEWKIADPKTPHIFCALGTPNPDGLGQSSSLIAPAHGHTENILDMLSRKDLLLMNFDAWEAEYVLRLKNWAVDTGKIVNCAPDDKDPSYWARRGVYVSELGPEEFADGLLPAVGRWYGNLDLLINPDKVIDLARSKPFDCFISYSRSDSEFVDNLDRSLKRRDVRTWRDVREVDVGDPIEETLEASLRKTHCFVVVMSPAAMTSTWVRKELELAVTLEQRDEIEIIPVIYQDCEMPNELQRYAFADLRGEGEQEYAIAQLATSIRKQVARAAGKIR